VILKVWALAEKEKFKVIKEVFIAFLSTCYSESSLILIIHNFLYTIAVEEQCAHALPEKAPSDGNTIAGPSCSGIDSSPPTTTLPPNPLDIAGNEHKQKHHAEKKDKKVKNSQMTHQKGKKDHKWPNKHHKSKATSDEDESSTEASSKFSESGSGGDNEDEGEGNDDDEDKDKEDDDDEPVNTWHTKCTSMDPKHWKVKPMTAVKVVEAISIKPVNTTTAPLPSLPPTAPLPPPPLSQPPSFSTSIPLSQPPSPVHPLPVHPSQASPPHPPLPLFLFFPLLHQHKKQPRGLLGSLMPTNGCQVRI